MQYGNECLMLIIIIIIAQRLVANNIKQQSNKGMQFYNEQQQHICKKGFTQQGKVCITVTVNNVTICK